ncbi:MAG: FAD-binding protein [Lachnospiraceae bacterium]|nr:FAD-binding protein [Lachnospiraceae bacterium]
MYKKITTDVLVAGAGLAGITAALQAALEGARVCLVSRGRICAGSSFYPGTWGLGLIGPESPEDESDLEETILSVGEKMADPAMVHTLVSGIADGIEFLEQLGVTLKKAANKNEKEFIPCFDHKTRAWNGLEKAGAEGIFKEKLAQLQVMTLEKTVLLELLQKEKAVCGALVKRDGEVFEIHSKAVILATGGMGGLFQYNLNTADVRGTGQYLALKAGAGLVNLEFIQMMPGYLKPAPKTIYNEKVFKYSIFQTPEKILFEDWNREEKEKCMEIRSTHGPFTTRLPSAAIDKEIFGQFLENPEGVKLTYKESLRKNQPEFVKTYFQWLESEKHLTIEDPVWLGIFAHASNGGIRIDTDAKTGVPGLYACGEASGMMHGADRMGGLSTANCLVFGRIAGRSAAAYSKEIKQSLSDSCAIPDFYLVPKAGDYLEEIKKLNFRSAMILRNQENSEKALKRLEEIQEEIRREERMADCEEISVQQAAENMDLRAALLVSQVLHKAILQRKESRGPHFRTDYPEKNPAFDQIRQCVLKNETLESELFPV